MHFNCLIYCLVVGSSPLLFYGMKMMLEKWRFPFFFFWISIWKHKLLKKKNQRNKGEFYWNILFLAHNMTTNAESQPSETIPDSVINKSTHQLKRKKEKKNRWNIVFRSNKSLISCSSTLHILDKTVTEPHPGCITCMIQWKVEDSIIIPTRLLANK